MKFDNSHQYPLPLSVVNKDVVTCTLLSCATIAVYFGCCREHILILIASLSSSQDHRCLLVGDFSSSVSEVFLRAIPVAAIRNVELE